MIPIDFEQSNFTFLKPEGMTEDECGDLPVRTGEDQNGFPSIISCWQLSEEDKVRVAKTGVVWLNICGQGMPPVCVQASNPFVEESELPNPMASQLNEMVNFCHTQAKNAGWHDKPRETGTCLMLVVSEVSEAMEGDRKGLMDDHIPHRKMFEVELADAVIRIFDLAGREGLDLGGALVEKLAYNLNRADHKRENRELEGGKKY